MVNPGDGEKDMAKAVTKSKAKRAPKPVKPGRKLKQIKGYSVQSKRTPSQRLQKLEITPWQTLGPFYPYEFLIKPGENDLTRIAKGKPRAKGEIIDVVGRVLDEDGRPVRGCLIEAWQCNAEGRYLHAADQSNIPIDPNFTGTGRVITDEQGRYRFHTIKPSPYPVPGYDNWKRPRHIHFSLYAAGILDRLITQMYFPGERMNRKDFMFNALPSDKARRALTGKASKGQRGTTTYTFDMILRGSQETPFFEV
tara:strand:+ start:7300 stop:8055 length:756 start_codon:yes stop_codon:yes gene_type:complete